MQILTSTFGRHYSFHSRYPRAFRTVVPERFNDYFFTRKFVSRFHATNMDWLKLANSTQSYFGWRNSHPHANIQDYIAHCLENKTLYVFEIKQGDKSVHSVARKGIKDSEGIRYQFAMASVLLFRQPEETQFFNSQADADDFLNRLNISQAQLESLNNELDLTRTGVKSKDKTQAFKDLSRALIDGSVLIAVDRGEKRHSLTTGDDYNDALAAKEELKTEQSFALGPHDDGSGSFTVADTPTNQAPQSLEDVKACLQKSRQQLEKTKQYTPKYSQQQLEDMVKQGTLQDRFVMNLRKTKSLDKPIGYRRDSGRTTTWTTTFDQMERADTDPKLLCDLNGMPYDPDADYELIVIDQGKYFKDDAGLTFIPNYENTKALGKQEFNKKFSAEQIDKVMSPEYSEEYAGIITEYKGKGGLIYERDDVKTFTNDYFDDQQAKSDFMARHEFTAEIGTNEHFSGDGLTKTTGDSGYVPAKQHGMLETITFEKDPDTVAELEAKNSPVILRMPMKPIV